MTFLIYLPGFTLLAERFFLASLSHSYPWYFACLAKQANFVKYQRCKQLHTC